MASRSPRRFVLDSRLRIPKSARLLRPGGPDTTVVVCAGAASGSVHGSARVLEIEANEHGRPRLAALLRELADEGVTRLMIEGGPTIATAFLDEGLVDEVAVFQGAGTIGASGLLPFREHGLERLMTGDEWQLAVERPVGVDTMRIHRRAGFVREIEVQGNE
jgi:diaminohydroxyphosphoribosylaminopyrimidine deaminase/5-amino-6-(5-phosphoribosylamino)uracil reductase